MSHGWRPLIRRVGLHPAVWAAVVVAVVFAVWLLGIKVFGWMI